MNHSDRAFREQKLHQTSLHARAHTHAHTRMRKATEIFQACVRLHRVREDGVCHEDVVGEASGAPFVLIIHRF